MESCWKNGGRQSQVEVAKCLNVNKSVVSKIWKQFIETGTIKRKEGSGRKRKTATSEDRYLVVTAKRHREMTAIQLSNELSSATGTRISRQLFTEGFTKVLFMKDDQWSVSARLNWCLEHHAWTHDQWANVLFSDESRFSFKNRFSTSFHLEGAWKPLSSQARLVNEYLQSENIQRMDWPSRSPDLNPIEHVWDALGKRIGARYPSPRTLVELRTALLEEWGLLPLDLLQSLLSSFDQVSKFDRGRIVAYRDCGLSFREIGSRVGRNQTTAMRICDRWMQEGTTDRRVRPHPPQCTTSRDDRRIVRMTGTDRSVTSLTEAQHIQSVTHHPVSARTIRRRLQQSDLSARRPLLRIPLTQNHRRLCRQWCDERRMWTAEWNEIALLTSHASVCNTTMVGF
ncbi:hypothetical protein LAZ67_2001095, partial [Cordylochernes scorpioides]